MGLMFKSLWKYDGLFERCYMEPCIHGWSLFDSKNKFVGMISDRGFAINQEYEHAEAVEAELTKRGINVFDYGMSEEIKNEMQLNALDTKQ